jgi:hypothetical protein
MRWLFDLSEGCKATVVASEVEGGERGAVAGQVIRRLNERFGYRSGIGRIYLVGPLA